jgi:hypothetical protein
MTPKITTTKAMLAILHSDKALTRRDFKPGRTIRCSNRMDKGKYSFVLRAKYGAVKIPGYFEPFFTPAQILKLGAFEGKYMNDCLLEYPKEWFLGALKKNTLSPDAPNVRCNYFQIKSRQSLGTWERKGWLYGPDNRGWFQWYCRYYCGRRLPAVDALQIKRWRAFQRHFAQVKKNCSAKNEDCRPKQRQALLQWAYNCFV